MIAEPLPTIDIETAPNPTHSVIWLHGLGADGNDFVPLVDEFALDCAVRFVFPHAPLMPVTINGGYVMRAWYDIAYEDLSLRADEKGVRASEEAVAAVIEREMATGIAARNIVLAGFSQGGAIALQTGLRYRERLGGILALSTYLPMPDKVEAERSQANSDIPIFMAHGSDDSIVPPKLAQASCEKLLTLGYKVEWREYPMPHSVCEKEVADIGEWLQGVLTR